MYYLRARYYDPSTGQFISRDPMVASTRQPYAYAYDNPTNLTDPTGLWGGGWGMDFLVGLAAGPGGYITGAIDKWTYYDKNGNNRTATGGAGFTKVGYPTGLGLFAGGGIHITGSNADSLSEQMGRFHNFTVAGGDLLAFSVTLSWGDNWGAHGLLPTMNLSVSGGPGVGAYAGVYDTSTTMIEPSGRFSMQDAAYRTSSSGGC
jgi:hypothetical protein